jgi:hypothetical protein
LSRERASSAAAAAAEAAEAGRVALCAARAHDGAQNAVVDDDGGRAALPLLPLLQRLAPLVPSLFIIARFSLKWCRLKPGGRCGEKMERERSPRDRFFSAPQALQLCNVDRKHGVNIKT